MSGFFRRPLQVAMLAVEFILDRIHMAHHVAHERVVKLIALHEEIVVEEIRVAQRIIEEH